MGLAAQVLGLEVFRTGLAVDDAALAAGHLMDVLDQGQDAGTDELGLHPEARLVGAGLDLDVEHLDQQPSVVAELQVQTALGAAARRRRRGGREQGRRHGDAGQQSAGHGAERGLDMDGV